MSNENPDTEITRPIDIETEMENSFLEYAMSVIVSRALPDVRDGLKPVHRRVLYSMWDSGIRPGTPYRKCARVVGDVVGWFHPHSPEAVYDSMVRLAQDFSLRYPVVDPQGNFGTVDDPPAAMRYCVAGETRIATADGSRRIASIAPDAAPDSDTPIEIKVLDRRGGLQVADTLFHSGTHATFTVRTEEGFTVTGTANHPLLTIESIAGLPALIWKRIDEIAPGERVAIARNYVPTQGSSGLTREDAMRASKSNDTTIPDSVWNASTDVKATFLAALFQAGGSLRPDAKERAIRVGYATQSEERANDVQRLLLEFGVIARLVRHESGGCTVVITPGRDTQLFAARVGFPASGPTDPEGDLGNVTSRERVFQEDEIPFIADFVRTAPGGGDSEWLATHDIGRVACWEEEGEAIRRHIPDTDVLTIVEEIVDHGFFYATVESVTPAGAQPVYSVRVDSDDHSFIGDGFVNHNTEARLAKLAAHMLDGIDEDTVTFKDNYSGERQEPSVLPSRFPNLLVNGSTGIAVGMATNMAPHNLGEVADAVLHALENPEATVEDLMQFVKGPDFPTGAYIVGVKGVNDALLTGRGSIKMRAVTDVVETDKGRMAIIASEIPYQVSRDRIMEKIAELVRKKTIAGISDLRDESDRHGMRLVIELKRDANAQVVLNLLFKHTQLEDTFSVNNVALVDGVPRTLNLAQLVHHYVDHQLEVIERRSKFRLAKAEARAHILRGLLIALDNIDKVVAIIRASANVDAARTALMEAFEFSEIQANHILDMPLRRLTALETNKLRDELRVIEETIAYLEGLLGDEAERRTLIATELIEVREKFADPRRSRIIPDLGLMSLEDLIADEELVISVSTAGYVKSVLASVYRTQGRGGRGIKGAGLRDDDVVQHLLHTSAHAYLLFFTNRGKVYRVRAHEIPRKDRTAKGQLIQSVLPMDADEVVEAIIDTRDYETNRYLVMFTKKGLVKKSKFSDYDSRNQVLVAINLLDGDEVVAVRQTNGEADLMMLTRNGFGIRFKESDVRSTGRASQGVRGIRLRDGDEVVSAAVADEAEEVLILTSGGYGKRVKMSEFRVQKRGGFGVISIKLARNRGVVAAACAVSLSDEIVVTSSDGIVMRAAVKSISRQKRPSTGVKVLNLSAGATLSALTIAQVVEE